MIPHPDHYRKDDPDRAFTKSRLWCEKLRPHYLRRYPLCHFCTALGLITAAEEIDHVVRPRGNTRLQRAESNWQALCKEHHQAKSLWERRDDGRPLVIGVAIDGSRIMWSLGGLSRD